MHIISTHSRASPFEVDYFRNLWNLCQYVKTNQKQLNFEVADSSNCYCYARQGSLLCTSNPSLAIVHNSDYIQTLALHSTSSLSCLLLQSSSVFHSFRQFGLDSTDSRSNLLQKKKPCCGLG